MTKTCAVFLAWCSVYPHLAALTTESSAQDLPDHFVYVEDVIPNVNVDLRYFTDRNFLGRPVDGYLNPRLILTREAAEALSKAREELNGFGLDLKIFDGYRPQRALLFKERTFSINLFRFAHPIGSPSASFPERSRFR